ncbi:MAG: hypothetical protein B6I36_06340 [Desulfobacteraceae bacterium 4572_35.1]|nr:MAG: hypothetical protein B6I36_06340 [Desulfobacteraceae bacterium 4572_35.1]
MFFNPASITLLEGQQITAGLHVIDPSTKFKADTATNVLGTSLDGNDGGDGGVTAMVPNLYYTNKLNDKLSIGLGLNAPFGLATDYGKSWVGRYYAVESVVETININPVVAYKVTDQLTLSAGVSAEYMDVTLSSMVDGGLVAFSAVRNAGGNPMPLAPVVSNPQYDVFAENTADDWGYGFNLGAMYEFTPNTRVGVAYRSEIEHKVEGKIKTKVPVALINLNPLLAGAFQNQDVHGTVTLPATASVNVYSKITNKLALMADVTWTDWSSFDKLTINFEGTGIAGTTSSTTTEKWDDSWRYSLGGTFQATDALLIRAGIAYDETPIPDNYRTPRIPGEDRFWVSLGAGYQITQCITMDAAYAHLFVSDSKMEKYASNAEDQSHGTVVGEFENSVDIFSVQLSYKF